LNSEPAVQDHSMCLVIRNFTIYSTIKRTFLKPAAYQKIKVIRKRNEEKLIFATYVLLARLVDTSAF